MRKCQCWTRCTASSHRAASGWSASRWTTCSGRDFAASLEIGYPVLVGAGDVFAVLRAYGNNGGMLPYSVLVDREGVVRWVKLGELKESELRQRVLPLL